MQCILLIILLNVALFAGETPTLKKQLIQGEQKMHLTDKFDVNEASLKKIISYMMWAPTDKVADTFIRMSLETKLLFLKRMNIHQYGWFLFAFSEEQWRHMWQQLPPEQQTIIPATKLEQLKKIRNSWQACSGGDIIFFAGGPRDPQARDLSLYRNRALSRIENFKTEYVNEFHDVYKKKVIFYRWLNGHFQAQKLKMLKALAEV